MSKILNNCSLSSGKYLNFLTWYARCLMTLLSPFLTPSPAMLLHLHLALTTTCSLKLPFFVLLYRIFFHLHILNFSTSYLLLVFKTSFPQGPCFGSFQSPIVFEPCQVNIFPFVFSAPNHISIFTFTHCTSIVGVVSGLSNRLSACGQALLP